MFHTFSAIPPPQSPEDGAQSESAKNRSPTASPPIPSPTRRMYHIFSAGSSSATEGKQTSPRAENKSPVSVNAATPRARPRVVSRESSGVQVQQTLTVCTRCRQRKIKCDPGLPRCTPCDKANAQCEYFDVTKRTVVSRKYVVWLQHKIQQLEEDLAKVEAEDRELDTELAVRNPGLVRLKESEETKFLGPSSGIAISRVVMNLAKQFTDSKSIKQIISETEVKAIEQQFAEEEAIAVPEQPPVPMYSEAPAVELPSRDLTSNLVNLFFTKVHPMYPVLHEPSFLRDIEAIYHHGSQDAFQNFALRMVIAVGLQRMDKQFAALADAYYLAALKFLEAVVQLKNLQTLQAYALIAAYSLLTPTRTAIYYVIGAAVRLAQALGFTNEATVSRGADGRPVDTLEVDMRRRLAWAMITMDFGLAHSLGRPSAMSVDYDDINLNFFEIWDDEYITRQGIQPSPVPSIKKWIAIHFFKMRLLQLEIRKRLYLKKRADPTDDSHPWFKQMEQKLIDWRDASPLEDTGTGLDKAWFIGRYNTILIFLYRPSPQVPKPTTEAALKCYDACQFNFLMHREQIKRRNVETTWIFVQSIFMAVNTFLWSLSYEEVRQLHARSEVQSYLDVGLESIKLSAERWPGAASAHDLYVNLIEAVLKIYDKDGEVQLSMETETVSPESMRPQSTPVALIAEVGGQISPLAKPTSPSSAPFGYIQPDDYQHANQPTSPVGVDPATPPGLTFTAPHAPPAQAPTSGPTPTSSTSQAAYPQRPFHSAGLSESLQLPPYNLPPTPGSPVSSHKPASSRNTSQSPSSYESLHYFHAQPPQPPPQPQQQQRPISYDPNSHYNQLPTTFAELSNWSPNFVFPTVSPNFLAPTSYPPNLEIDTSATSPFEHPASAIHNYEFGTSPNSAVHPQHQQQYQDYYPDPYWTVDMLTQGVGGGATAMHGNGLAADQQAGLMQNLESIGPEQIERMIAESNAFFSSQAVR